MRTTLPKILSVTLFCVVLAVAPSVGADTVSASSLNVVRTAWTLEFPQGDFDQRLGYQRDFRSQFDFLAEDDASIARVMGVAATNDAVERWGLKLSDQEYAELDRRVRIQKELPDIAAAAVGDAWSEELLEGLAAKDSFGAFGGRWIDQQNGGRLTIALSTEHPDYLIARSRVEAAVSDLVADQKLRQDDVAIVDVIFTADDLQRVNREFSHSFLERTDRDSIGMSASMNPVENRVDLYTTPEWEVEAYDFASGFEAGLVNVIVRERDEWSGRPSTLPAADWGAGNWHAGARITIFNGSQTALFGCGWGATGRTASYVYVITAAHCLGFPSNGSGQYSWWNNEVASSDRRGVRSSGGGDIIASSVAHNFVLIYNGVRGDLARLAITHASNANDYDCYLESYTICGRHITRRELTTETDIGDVRCMSYATTAIYSCGTINSNDAAWVGKDYLRQVNLGSSNHADDGDSGGGWKTASLMTGIHLGDKACPNCDAVFTHAYYIEKSGYLALTSVCGTSTICNN